MYADYPPFNHLSWFLGSAPLDRHAGSVLTRLRVGMKEKEETLKI